MAPPKVTKRESASMLAHGNVISLLQPELA